MMIFHLHSSTFVVELVRYPNQPLDGMISKPRIPCRLLSWLCFPSVGSLIRLPSQIWKYNRYDCGTGVKEIVRMSKKSRYVTYERHKRSEQRQPGSHNGTFGCYRVGRLEPENVYVGTEFDISFRHVGPRRSTSPTPRPGLALCQYGWLVAINHIE